VAVGADLLRQHAVTGQSPIEDRHLGALLTWFESDGTSGALERAQQAAIIPSSGILLQREDERVEHLRNRAKRERIASKKRGLVQEVRDILHGAALREWGLLIRARAALHALRLPSSADGLVAESLVRFRILLGRNTVRRASPHTIARHLEDQEYSIEATEAAEIGSDVVIRQQAAEKGRVVVGEIVAMNRPRPGFRPCIITVVSRQPIIRLRCDKKVQTIAGKMSAVVRQLGSGLHPNETHVTLELLHGFRPARNLRIGSPMEWSEAMSFNLFLRKKKYALMQSHNSPIVYSQTLPPPRPRALAPTNLVQSALAELKP
jgi:hypothetical protein